MPKAMRRRQSRAHQSILDGAQIPHDGLAPLQVGCNESPPGYVPSFFSVDVLGLPAPGGEGHVRMEAIGEIAQRLTWRGNTPCQLGDKCVLFDL